MHKLIFMFLKNKWGHRTFFYLSHLLFLTFAALLHFQPAIEEAWNLIHMLVRGVVEEEGDEEESVPEALSRQERDRSLNDPETVSQASGKKGWMSHFHKYEGSPSIELPTLPIALHVVIRKVPFEGHNPKSTHNSNQVAERRETRFGEHSASAKDGWVIFKTFSRVPLMVFVFQRTMASTLSVSIKQLTISINVIELSVSSSVNANCKYQSQSFHCLLNWSYRWLFSRKQVLLIPLKSIHLLWIYCWNSR